tara:strand:+ start:4542 stop:5354 length:813 start_codon:yes stop_codon:yes gene_type:complete
MKIYDCFKFFNELELLELRLMELNETVDYFVLVEASKTHTGNDKEYIFEKNKHLFEEYLSKIIHIKVDDLPAYSKTDHTKFQGGIWEAENFQRNCIMRGLGSAKPGDKIIVSDVDEIPNTDTIKKHLDEYQWITLRQDLFYYYVNCKQNCHWDGPIMANFGTFESPQKLRNAARDGFNARPQGGWHYSFMGGPERIKTKVESIAESHFIIEGAGTVDDIEDKMKSQKDLWNRTDSYARKEIVDISHNRPKTLGRFLEKNPHFIYRKETQV